ncbi:MAG: PfkB family carbohydrate kinase, partial [Clostridia bacterium]
MKLLAFGEILFDIFGSEKHIGGAPLNFACHFSKLGGESYMASAVGADSMGDEALKYLKKYNVKTDFTAQIDGFSTGSCIVTLKDGIPGYNLVRDVAYDNIPIIKIEKDTHNFDALYFGTLAERNETSSKTLDYIIKEFNYREVFYDINIRQTFYDFNKITERLKKATILKLSRDEMFVFGTNKIDALFNMVCQKNPFIKLIILTLDKDGSMVFDAKSKTTFQSRKPCAKVVST